MGHAPEFEPNWYNQGRDLQFDLAGQILHGMDCFNIRGMKLT